jgi:putative membrane protein
MIKSVMLLTAASLSLAACGHKEDTTTTNTVVPSDTVVNDSTTMDNGAMDNTAMTNTAAVPSAAGGQAFANMAAASDAFEIATSKAALTTSSSAAIKKYAQKMIDAHTASTAKLKATAAGLTPAITPNPALNAEQEQKLAALTAKTGADFDQDYIAEQTAAHQQTLDTLKGYAATGDVPALKTFATGLVPTVAAHLNMAKALKS